MFVKKSLNLPPETRLPAHWKNKVINHYILNISFAMVWQTQRQEQVR